MMSEGDLLIPCDPFKTINIIVYRMTRIKIHLYLSLKLLVFLFYLCHVLIYFLSLIKISTSFFAPYAQSWPNFHNSLLHMLALPLMFFP